MSANPGDLEQGPKEEESDLLPVAASTLPTPESIEEGKGLPAYPPGTPVPKGVIGAIARTFKGIPPCVWVINQHYEEITVVVSKYRPKRLITGGEIEISLSGGAFSLNATTYLGPATKKTLGPYVKNRGAPTAVFPLWDKRDGFGVISIFTGPDRVLYIENDRIPAGATAYFQNEPDLALVAYKKESAKTF
ncbi:hypothetical protein F4860DRAFT_519990 [Xylaria cubensis]|nr:hypothetical protein F4860DRAFT_519990 [Xylaria cubensis]